MSGSAGAPAYVLEPVWWCFQHRSPLQRWSVREGVKDLLKRFIKILCNAAELTGGTSRQSIRVHVSEGDLLPFEWVRIRGSWWKMLPCIILCIPSKKWISKSLLESSTHSYLILLYILAPFKECRPGAWSITAVNSRFSEGCLRAAPDLWKGG